MPYVLVRHKVRDYDLWKSVFDEHGDMRRDATSAGGILLRNKDDPNEVFILLEYTDLERARQFIDSDDLRRTMERAGVADVPDISFLEEVDRPTV
jgi:hypothetical protein